MPTILQAMTKLAAAVKGSRRLYLQAASLVQDHQDFLDAVKATPPYSADLEDAVQDDRNEVEGFLAPERLKAKLQPALLAVAKSDEINTLRTDPNEILDLVNAFLNTSGKRVKSRVFVRGAASSGIGKGTLKRVWKNRYGFDLEASYPETRTFTVEEDQNTGASRRGREVVRIEGALFGGQIERGVSGRGSGWSDTRTAVAGSDSLVPDPNFTSVKGTDAAPASLSNWTMSPNVGDGTDWVVDRTYYWMEDESDNKLPGCIFFKGTGDTTIQRLISDIGAIVAGTPYYVGVRAAVADGAAAAWVGNVKPYWGKKSISYPLCGAVLTATPGGAGNVDVGDHYLGVSFVNTAGVEGPICAWVKVTIASSAKTIALSAIPIGPSDTASRNVYASKAGDISASEAIYGFAATKMFLLVNVAGNATTTGTYNVSDATLASGANPWQVAQAENRTSTARYVLLDSLGPTAAQADTYPENWTSDIAAVGVEVLRTAGAGVYLSKFLFLPMDALDGNDPRPGQFGLLIGGSVPWMKGDTWTVADTCGTGVLNEDLFLAFGQTLLGTSGTADYPDPVVP